MDKLHVIYGEESFLRSEEIKKILLQSKTERSEVITYDCESVDILDIVEDIITFPFFNEYKVILLKNIPYVTNKISNYDDSKIKKLIECIVQPTETTILIFNIETESLNGKNRIIKALREKAVIKECNKFEPNELKMKVISSLTNKGFEIDVATTELLVKRCNNEISKVINELTKLSLYKKGSKVITSEDVMKLVANNMESDVFELTNSIMKKNKIKTLQIAGELIDSRIDPIQLLTLIGNSFKNILKVKELQKEGYTKYDIASTLGFSPGRVGFLIKDSNSFIEEKVKDVILELADMDFKIKSGKMDRFLAFDLFINKV